MRDERLTGHLDYWGGFGSEEHWELARWMLKSGLSQGQIDKFLKLKIVSGHNILGLSKHISPSTDQKPPQSLIPQQTRVL